MTHVCKNCKTEFEAWNREVECDVCDDGDEEVEAEFGEGYHYRTCRSCKGAGVRKVLESRFCDEGCVEDYYSAQFN
jgi:hypothetical protein